MGGNAGASQIAPAFVRGYSKIAPDGEEANAVDPDTVPEYVMDIKNVNDLFMTGSINYQIFTQFLQKALENKKIVRIVTRPKFRPYTINNAKKFY